MNNRNNKKNTKKTISILLALLVFLVTIGSALATVDVTYNFDQNDVQAEAYACVDSGCYNVVPFAGTIQSSTNDGTINVQYPTNLQTSYGYAVYFTSPGFIPKEDLVTLAGSGTVVRDNVLSFSQVNQCKTTIDSFEVIDVSMPYMPITINANTLLDAWTYSAFKSLNTGVNYVPPNLLDYYSADTMVTLTINDEDGNLVESQSLPLSIFVDDMAQVSFTWTPQSAGQYTAKVEVVVTDDQCSSYGAPQSSTKQFEVLETLPMNACYTLLNGLAPVQLNPKVGDLVEMMFDKISNHANDEDPYGPNYVLTPVDTEVNYKVYAPGGQVVLDETEILEANSWFSWSELFTFDFPALFAGTYTVEVVGKAADSMCSGLTNVGDMIQNTLFVENSTSLPVYEYAVTFDVNDASGDPVIGSQVVFHGQIGFTNTLGELVFNGVTTGTYAYAVDASGFTSASGSVSVASDLTVTVTLQMSGSDDDNDNPPTDDEEEDGDRYGLHVSSIRIPSAFDAASGESMPMYVHLKNNGDFNLENLKVTVVIQELAVRKSVGPFDLKKNREVSKTILLDLPAGVESGTYSVRLTLENEGVKRVIYREMTFGGQ